MDFQHLPSDRDGYLAECLSFGLFEPFWGENFQKLSAPNEVQSIDIEVHSYRAMYSSTQGLYTHDCSSLGPLFRKLASGQSRGQQICPVGQVARKSRPGHPGGIYRLVARK